MDTEVETEDGTASLRMSVASEPGRWALVGTPGDRWVFVQVNGGFTRLHFEEGIEDDDLKELLSQFVEIGVAYLKGSAIGPSGRVFPVLSVATDDGTFKLRRSLAADLREMFRIRLRRSEESDARGDL
ncbi:hypothetical protein [Agromyces sp. Root81]|uniref:hypothetical protein n=1 Tax=Agromyces sp. Root81 TaxID=1736601 RepID=UPI0012FBAA94|nr:hypothetical protein [Agromyces sp. Root81]